MRFKKTCQFIFLKFMIIFIVVLNKSWADSDFYLMPKKDNYNWMEVDNKKTDAWLQYKTHQSKKIINNINFRESVKKQIEKISESEENYLSSIYDAGNKRFYLRNSSEHPYSRLFVENGTNNEKLLIDPPVGMGIIFFSPSPDGNYVAYGLSKNGSEIASIRILDVNLGHDLKDAIPHARYPHIVWRPDNHSFFYSRLPPEKHNVLPSENLANKKVYLHNIGCDYKEDPVILHSGMFSDIDANIYSDLSIYSSPNSDWLLASISSSTSGYSSALYITSQNNIKKGAVSWKKIVDKNQGVSSFVILGNWLFLAKYNGLSGYSITRISLDQNNIKEEEVFNWSNGELMEFATSNESLYVAYHDSGIRKFVRIDINNIHVVHDIPLPFDGEVTALFSSYDKKTILFTLQNWVNPPAIYSYNPDGDTVINTNLISSPEYDFHNYEAEETWVLSKDGVRIPLTIIKKKGYKPNGLSRAWLTAYGAYGQSIFPNFDPFRLIWLQHGGIIAIAHVRGGGELGPSWHEEGRIFKKENSINDFLACAEYLIDKGYANKTKLVASGASAGGIIVGRAITIRPDIFSAIAIDVGILNISRLKYIPIGPMNFKEFGSPEIIPEMDNLHKLDAYEHLVEGIRYPAVLLTIGLNDNRVSPWQSAKFAARLDEISLGIKNSNRSFVIAEKNAGHSASNHKQSDEKFLDTISFFMWKTGGY